MKRITLWLILGALISLPLFGDTTWIRKYRFDPNKYAMEPWWVIQTSDDGYMLYAYNCGYGFDEAWLFRTDPYGDTLWTRKFPDLWKTFGDALQQTTDGGYIFIASEGSIEHHQDVWLCKLDSLGQTVWQKTYGGEDYEYGQSVQQTADGGYIVSGSKGDSVWLIKTDPYGDTLWTRAYMEDERWDHCGNSVKQTMDKGYIICTGRGYDFGLIKTDSDGDVEWSRLYEGKGRGSCVEQTTDGGYVVASSYSSSCGSVIKTDPAGDVEWSRDISARRAHQTYDGSYIVAEHLTGADKLIKLDTDGNTVWEREYEGSIYSVKQTSDGGYIFTLTKELFSEFWLVKTNDEGKVFTGVEKDVVETQPSLKVVGSVGPEVTLRYADFPQGFSASIFDASARKVDEVHSAQACGIITWGEGIEPGVYFIRPLSDVPSTAYKVVLIK